MERSEYVITQEGEPLERSSDQQIRFEPSATARIGFGGYSTVYKEVIPAVVIFLQATFVVRGSPLMIFDAPKSPLPVARKYFPYTPDFDRELLFLETVNSPPYQGHDRIIKHLAVVRKPHAGNQPPTVGTRSLIFPLADCDLGKYLSSEDFSNFAFKDLMKELSQLADALAFLHHRVKTSEGLPLVGSHMDLNPSNILIFLGGREDSAVGTWKITDFSTSTLTDEEGHDYMTPPKLVPDIYNAPEIQVPIEKNEAAPACDVWSLGCIIFEVLVGYVEGKRCKSWKDKHGNSRCYYEDNGEVMTVESRVWKWLNADDAVNPVGMCKQLVMDVLRIDPKERPTAEQIRDSLEMLSE